MKDRAIDTLLLIGLVVVGLIIMWTLFTLEPDSSARAVPETQADVAQARVSESTDDPIPDVSDTEASADAEASTELSTEPEDGPVEAVDLDMTPDSGAASGEISEASGAETAEPSQASEETEAETSRATPPAAGEASLPSAGPEIALERVGFSFVTGGPGACGVVLEPWQHVAVSRDILANYGCGSEVTLYLEDETGGRQQVRAVIADTMNPVHSRTVNVYVATDEPALSYGVTTGTLEVGP